MVLKRSKQKAHPIFGWICIILGFYPISIAFGIIPIPENSTDSPMWLMGLCGFVFMVAGIMILIGQKSKYNSLGAVIICFCFSLIGAWIALFASAEGFSGGIPLLSKTNNTIIARLLFGFGAILSSLMSVFALRQFLKSGK